MTVNTLALLSYHLAFNSLICTVILQIDCVSDLTCCSLVQSRTFPDDTKYPAKLHQSGSARWAAITSRPCMSVALAQWTVTSHSGKAPVGQRNLFSTQWLIGDPGSVHLLIRLSQHWLPGLPARVEKAEVDAWRSRLEWPQPHACNDIRRLILLTPDNL